MTKETKLLIKVLEWLEDGVNTPPIGLRGAIKEALATSPLPVQPNHIVDANKMVQPEHEPSWYCVDKIGMATLCADKDDAEQSAKLAEQDFPRNSPYRAVQLCEYTPAITAHNIGAK